MHLIPAIAARSWQDAQLPPTLCPDAGCAWDTSLRALQLQVRLSHLLHTFPGPNTKHDHASRITQQPTSQSKPGAVDSTCPPIQLLSPLTRAKSAESSSMAQHVDLTAPCLAGCWVWLGLQGHAASDADL